VVDAKIKKIGIGKYSSIKEKVCVCYAISNNKFFLLLKDSKFSINIIG
jgi:hypothetical protein